MLDERFDVWLSFFDVLSRVGVDGVSKGLMPGFVLIVAGLCTWFGKSGALSGPEQGIAQILKMHLAEWQSARHSGGALWGGALYLSLATR
ncbi:MAG: hypothetical protein ACRBBQ_11005 [Cognatishimia sp.]